MSINLLCLHVEFAAAPKGINIKAYLGIRLNWAINSGNTA